ncbi:MAG: 3-oxoacyl-[acyl-carrier-protein] reductase [Lactobacillales bacterium]|jgi:3-oxoacyl-[acyl-carrier protein] reductase|nr:3-oxoacyl-[acyl-carrier-protein] reductase [Lactobacillales bacterium]
MSELKGKNVLVTGSDRGIGLAVIEAFAAQGANVAVNGYDSVDEATLQNIRDTYGVKAIGVIGDVSNFETAGKLIAETIEGLGSVDVLVNNAGITRDGLLLRMSPEDFDAVINVNLKGTFNMTQQVLKGMIKNKFGRIINIASVVALQGNAGQANYVASKAGIIGLTKTAAREVGRKNVTVNAIAPGFINTKMTEVLSDTVKNTMLAQIPLNRFGEVEDIAQAAIFLAQASYVTGQTISVNGGMVMP